MCQNKYVEAGAAAEEKKYCLLEFGRHKTGLMLIYLFVYIHERWVLSSFIPNDEDMKSQKLLTITTWLLKYILLYHAGGIGFSFHLFLDK